MLFIKTPMKPFFLVCAFLVSGFVQSIAQVYTAKSGSATFFSAAPLENIEATSTSVQSILNTSTKNVAFIISIRSFQFKKDLMQEHFNENYVESDKFPKASFKGTVSDIASVNLAKDGTYKLKVNGQLTLHGVTKEIETIADFTVRNGTLSASSDFTIECADYDIQIPGLVKDKVAKTVNINILANYELYKAF